MNTDFCLYEDLALPYIKQIVQNLMKCRVMWHTILVFTVCKSTHLVGFVIQGNYYTMGCPPVRGDNPRALASGLSYVQVDKHGINIFYTIYISLDLAHHKIFRAKVGKDGIKGSRAFSSTK